jgi:thiol-disulfide isomerase/thioredoxin
MEFLSSGGIMELIYSMARIQELIENNEMLLLYFGSNNCNVCVAIKPKIEKLIKEYNKINCVQVDIDKSVEIAAQYNIFSIPAILLFIRGKETIREVRFISIEILSDKIARYHDILN